MNHSKKTTINEINRYKSGRLAAALAMFVFLASSIVLAQTSDPTSVKNQANNNIQVASKLMDQAASLLSGTPTRYAMKTAVELYAQAGQMAEQASKLYEALGSKYATAADVENSKLLVQRCIENIQHIRQRM